MPQYKYICVSIEGVITQIAIQSSIKGYTEGILQTFYPDESEYKNWTKKQNQDWVLQNNKRMKAICKFLNDNNL